MPNTETARVPVMGGIGVYLPRNIVSSRDLDAKLGLRPGWIERNCGVFQRHVVSGDETQERMGAEAARAALRDAKTDGRDIDLLLFAAAVGRQPIPATAPLIKQELGLSDAPFPAYDVNATCLSALVAMDVAAMHISTGRARNVLVVASEIASRALPWQSDPRTAGLFGDGAAAFVVRAGDDRERRRIGAVHMETYAEGYDFCELRAGGTRYDFQHEREAFTANSEFAMQGMSLYRLSSEAAPGFIARLLDKAGWRQGDVDLVVPHQASPHALAHIIKRCGFAADHVVDFVAQIGNQVAASWPIAFHMAREQGRIEPGMKLLVLGTSAGVSLGGAAMVA
ncbi:3-oxoacyl-[acyl-carrier-protein] synthase III C-terminal domain-containing protein [Terricaulis sp.]|uniref:3-oxoacyl-[acyl-carrier-protein] synthase III C-terminal domain-containing protein n=1 Tax=Terricaulis sp. TaxID=2768686 RepID=UPI003783FC69